MKKFDQIFLYIIYAPIFPILLFLLFWWSSLLIIKDMKVFIIALLGLLIGLIIDKIKWKKWQEIGFKQKTSIMVSIYLFYSFGFFGFFMGVPIFNVFLGIFAGIYAVRKSIIEKKDQNASKKFLKKVAWFCVSILFIVCLGSAYFALSDPFTAGNLEGMLQLNFKITNYMIYGIIAFGGLVLLITQYLVVYLSGLWTLKHFNEK